VYYLLKDHKNDKARGEDGQARTKPMVKLMIGQERENELFCVQNIEYLVSVKQLIYSHFKE